MKTIKLIPLSSSRREVKDAILNVRLKRDSYNNLKKIAHEVFDVSLSDLMNTIIDAYVEEYGNEKRNKKRS